MKGIIKNKVLKCSILMFLPMLVLTGCWDMVEIENRQFVLLLGVDKKEAQYKIIYGIPDVSKYKENPRESLKLLTTDSKTLSMGKNSMTKEISRKMFLGHTKMIILGEAILQDEIAVKALFDSLIEDNELDKGMYVMAIEGKVDGLNEVKQQFNISLTEDLEGLSENAKNTAGVYKITLEELIQNLLKNQGTAIIPKIKVENQKITMSGGVLLKNHKLVGYLKSEEIEALRWMSKDSKRGTMSIINEKEEVPFSYYRWSSKINKVEETQEQINVIIDMKVKGNISEYSNANIKELEAQCEKQIEKQCKETIEYLQKDLGADVIGIREHIQKWEPKLYEKIKNNYEETFRKKTVITPQVKVKIIGIGTGQ